LPCIKQFSLVASLLEFSAALYIDRCLYSLEQPQLTHWLV
jgi:hypothetical protein